MTKQVRAISTGFDNLCIREPGEVFDMPDNASAPWFEDVNPKPKAKTVKLATAAADKQDGGQDDKQNDNQDDKQGDVNLLG